MSTSLPGPRAVPGRLPYTCCCSFSGRGWTFRGPPRAGAALGQVPSSHSHGLALPHSLRLSGHFCTRRGHRVFRPKLRATPVLTPPEVPGVAFLLYPPGWPTSSPLSWPQVSRVTVPSPPGHCRPSPRASGRHHGVCSPGSCAVRRRFPRVSQASHLSARSPHASHLTQRGCHRPGLGPGPPVSPHPHVRFACLSNSVATA